MHRPIPLSLTALALVAASASGARAQGATGAMAAVSRGALVWNERNVPGFAPGMKIAGIHGNPDSAGAYTLRLSFPDGYRFPPHWHPMAENITVLEGTLLLAMGERLQESSLKSYGVGDYLYVPPKHPHYGGARGYTVIQLHGLGPFAINLVTQPGVGNR
jgi:quercetin dioxygenase-like cupin family protein